MIETETKLRKWGSSFGLFISKKEKELENLKTGANVKVLIMKAENPLKKTFGTLKFKKSTQKMLEETDKELDIGF